MRTSNFGLGRRVKAAALVAVACGCTLLSGCGPEVRAEREWTPADHGQPSAEVAADDQRAAPPPEAEQEAGDPGARAARALWGVSCAGCHGRSGRGDGPTPPPGASMPNFTLASFQEARTDTQLEEAIREGRGLMPSFTKQLSPQAITALVGHIRQLGVASEPQPQGSAPAAKPQPATAEGAVEAQAAE